MMAEEPVSDSTDWLSTPLAVLTPVEASLRCQVCKDFYRTPMITTCFHTFCSLCIRRALADDGKCPMCRAREQEMRLRSNWAMEETVEAFTCARPKALAAARDIAAERQRLKRSTADGSSGHRRDEPEPKRLRTSARLNGKSTSLSTKCLEDLEQEGMDDAFEYKENNNEDEDFEPEPDDGLVACPLCNRRMKEWQVFKHLEACPGPANEKQQSDSSSSMRSPALIDQSMKQQSSTERLPSLGYSILKEAGLRKKMMELGISSHGPRPLLERRHKEWITLWNANCDSARPRKRTQLLHDLDTWERTQGGKAPVTGKAAQNALMIKDKDFDGDGWARAHDDAFRDLIASARNSVGKSKEDARGEEETSRQTNSPTPAPLPMETKEESNGVIQEGELTANP